MSIKESKTVYSDVTGEPVERSYPVGVLFDNAMHVVDIDRDNIEEDLAALTLADVVAKGRIDKNMRRNSRTSLNAQLHSEAREWAQREGIEVGERGIVPQEILTQYLAWRDGSQG